MELGEITGSDVRDGIIITQAAGSLLTSSPGKQEAIFITVLYTLVGIHLVNVPLQCHVFRISRY